MRELSIVQPYVPRYRVAFFDGLASALRSDGIDLRVIAGTPSKSQGARDDAATADWLRTVTSRVLEIGSRHLSLTYSRALWGRSDAVIVPHQGSSLDTASALVRRSGLRVGVWGHIAPYTSPLNVVDGVIERWQLRRAHHVFAYTPGGATFARRVGVAPADITTVMNTIDSAALQRELAQVSAEQARAVLRDRGVPEGPYLAYVGGLDESKRIRLLAAALDVLHRRGSRVHLVVLGRGDQSRLLAPAVARGQVSMLGYGGPADKAVVLRCAQAVVNPGRVGLLAVDCLVSRTPLITTDWPWHAPELEYLLEGDVVQVTPGDPDDFADAMIVGLRGGFARDDEAWSRPPSLEQMIGNFRRGVQQLLDGEIR